jgi:hypothetical protein
MPENLHFHIHDAFAPFPEEHQGIYDIVHVRFMVLVVMDTERVASVLDNLIALLSTQSRALRNISFSVNNYRPLLTYRSPL